MPFVQIYCEVEKKPATMYESRLQDKDKEIERLSGLLSMLLHK